MTSTTRVSAKAMLRRSRRKRLSPTHSSPALGGPYEITPSFTLRFITAPSEYSTVPRWPSNGSVAVAKRGAS
jgi:hypothetical protein